MPISLIGGSVANKQLLPKMLRNEVERFSRGSYGSFINYCRYTAYLALIEVHDTWELLNASEDDAKMFALFVAEAIEQGDL